jgi:hypothetical protein
MERQIPARPDPTGIARRRPPTPPTTTDLIRLIRFKWTTRTGSQPVIFVERRLLH